MKVKRLIAGKDVVFAAIRPYSSSLMKQDPWHAALILSSSLAGCKNEYDHPKDFNVFPCLY